MPSAQEPPRDVPPPSPPRLAAGSWLRSRFNKASLNRFKASFVARMDQLHRGWLVPIGALVALIISLSNLYALHHEPDLFVALPKSVRVAQGREVWLYMQPSFLITGNTDRTVVISNLTLQVQRMDSSRDEEEVAFDWDELGTWSFNPDNSKLDWHFSTEPTPLIISKSQPQSPNSLFVLKDAKLDVGRYELTLIAERGRHKVKEQEFCLEISPEDLQNFRRHGQSQHFTLPIKESCEFPPERS